MGDNDPQDVMFARLNLAAELHHCCLEVRSDCSKIAKNTTFFSDQQKPGCKLQNMFLFQFWKSLK